MDKDTLFLLVANSIDENGELPEDFHLPQEEEQQFMFADGAQDGIYIYHMGHSPLSREDDNKLGELIRMASEGEEDEAEAGFYKFCQKNRAISIIDEVQKYIVEHASQIKGDNMYRFAIDMMMSSNHIECVKIGMIILELFDTDENDALADAIRAIGVSDEFTIFSVFIMRHWDNGAMEVLELAKHVHGWGRIHCIDFIEPENDEIKEWILENGVDNYVMPAYSGMVAFEKADVMEVLAKDQITKKEMQGVLKIVSAMLDEGPVSGISNLDEPETFLVSVVNKAKNMIPLEVHDYEIINEIDKWQEYNGVDDNPELDSAMNEIFCNEDIRNEIAAALKEGNAIGLASSIGIPYKDIIYDLVVNDFDEYYYLCDRIIKDDDYTDKVIAIFEEKIDLGKIASGAGSELGLGREFKEHRKLDQIIYNLRNYPNKGEKIISAALQSPVIRNRNSAVNVLQCWIGNSKKTLLTICPEIYQLIKEIKDKEVEEDIVNAFEELISGCINFSEMD